MPAETQLNDLLSLWENRRQDGESVTPEELCRDCPELLDELPSHVQALEAMNSRLDSAPFVEAGSASVPTEIRTATRYRVLSHFAEGGLGEVLLARDDHLGRNVALKLIKRPHDRLPERRQRFLREAEITSRLGLERSRLLLEQVARAEPANRMFQINLSDAHRNFGDLAVAQGDWPAARDAFFEALKIANELLQTDPTNRDYRGFVSLYAMLSSDAKVKLGELEAAAAGYRSALGAAKSLNREDPRDNRALNLLALIYGKLVTLTAECGRHADAAELADQMVRDLPKGAVTDFNLARCLGRCVLAVQGKNSQPPPSDPAAQADEYARRAIEKLRDAQAAGYFTPAETVADLKRDEAFTGLRPRPEFQALLRQLEAEHALTD